MSPHPPSTIKRAYRLLMVAGLAGVVLGLAMVGEVSSRTVATAVMVWLLLALEGGVVMLHKSGRVRTRAVVAAALGGPLLFGAIAWVLVWAGIL
jgi:lysylphosphatidylglycerol synthetase-like protein (DUF2156 family)